jgi:hypothetical protein
MELLLADACADFSLRVKPERCLRRLIPRRGINEMLPAAQEVAEEEKQKRVCEVLM